MANNNLTYTIISPTYGSRAVSPLGESSFKIKWELNDDPEDPILDYNVTFDGTLIFTGRDYDFIKDIEESPERCEILELIIKKPSCGDVELVANTVIKLSDAEYNADRCQVKVSVITADKYENYNLTKDDELNIFDSVETTIPVLPLSPDSTIECAFFTLPLTSIEMNEDGLYNYFPNHNAEFPGYGIDTEEVTATVFGNIPLFNFYLYTTNLVTGNANLFDGCDQPLNEDYATAADARAEGWRLYYCYYRIDLIGTYGAQQYGEYGWAREVTEVPTGTGKEGWIFLETIGANDKYARPPRMIRRVRKWDCNAVGGETIVTDDFRAATSIVISQYSNYIIGLLDFDCGFMFGGSAFRNGVLLNSIIEYTAGHCFPGLEVKSKFFQINPDTPDTDNPITGEPSTTTEIVVFQKTDILRPYVTEVATKGLYKPSELFMWLLQQFKVKFRIDTEFLYLEHETDTVFIHAPVYDITAEPLNASKNVYRYDKLKLPSKKTFDFMEKKNIDLSVVDPLLSDFNGANILYDGVCVDRSRGGSTSNTQVSRVTNDIEFLISESEIEGSTTRKNSAEVSDDGFAFVATEIIGDYHYAISAPPILADIDQINNVMGWAYLHAMFFRSNANATTGTMNNAAITFSSTRYIKISTDLKVPECCITGFDPFAEVTSTLGDGRIKSAVYSIKNNIITMELGYRV